MIRLAGGAILLATAIAAPHAVLEPERQLVTRAAYLMGTRSELATYATSRRAGLARLDAALQVLEDAERELSTWRPDSDVSQLNQQPPGREWSASPRLCRLLAEVFDWEAATGGAFDPAVGRLLDAWNVRGTGAVPDERSLADARAASGLDLLSFDRGRCVATRRKAVTLDAGAFGKGAALDRLGPVLGTEPWMIDLGGQVSVGGAAAPDGGWSVGVADPRDRDDAVLHVRLREGSLATSGGSERDASVNGVRVGHIIDPRTGRPASFNGSVSVWHTRALAADVLSTALYVMGPDEGMRWATERGVAVCYLIPDGDDVRVEATPAFRALLVRRSPPASMPPRSSAPGRSR